MNPPLNTPRASAPAQSYRLELLRALPDIESAVLRKLGFVRRYKDGVTLAQRGQLMTSVLVLVRQVQPAVRTVVMPAAMR